MALDEPCSAHSHLIVCLGIGVRSSEPLSLGRSEIPLSQNRKLLELERRLVAVRVGFRLRIDNRLRCLHRSLEVRRKDMGDLESFREVSAEPPRLQDAMNRQRRVANAGAGAKVS